MKRVISLFILMILFSSLGFAQESSVSAEKPSSKLNIEPAIGSGASNLSMSLSHKKSSESVQYDSANDTFYFLNLSYKNLSAGLKFPQKTDQHSKVTDYQLAFGFLQNWKAEFYYQKYQGYYMNGKAGKMMNADLAFEHVGTQMIYIFNPKYAHSMIHDSSWDQDESAGSFSIGIGYDRFLLKGDLVPESFVMPFGADSVETKSVRVLVADSLVLRPGYGYNWIWRHWYAGLAGGLGIASNAVQYHYIGAQGTTSSLGYATHIGMSFGYRWNGNKVGFFTRSYQWTLEIDDKSLSSSTGLNGFFISSIF